MRNLGSRSNRVVPKVTSLIMSLKKQNVTLVVQVVQVQVQVPKEQKLLRVVLLLIDKVAETHLAWCCVVTTGLSLLLHLHLPPLPLLPLQLLVGRQEVHKQLLRLPRRRTKLI